MARSTVATSAASASSRNRGVLLLAAVFGVLSAGLMFAFLSNRGGSNSSLDKALNAGNGAESVLVVTRDVGAGEKLTADMMTAKTIPGSVLLPGRYADNRAQDLVGKVATAPMYEGEQVIEAKVTSYEQQDSISYKVPEGMRAIGLMVPHEAWIVGGLPQPGDRVDILGITTLSKMDPLTGTERPDVVAGVIAENAEVLAVSQKLVKVVVNTDLLKKADPSATAAAAQGTPAATPAVAPAVKGGEPDTFEKAISITIAVPLDVAAKVAIIDAMKDDIGQFRILSRQKGDNSAITGALLWSLEDVFTQKKK